MRDYEDYERGEEIKALGQAAAANLLAILNECSADNVADFARNVYKYTNCGASIGVLVYAGEDNPGRWVYGDDLHKLTPTDFVTAIGISSIVEGVEQGTSTHTIDLFSDDAVTAYEWAIEAVEQEADQIWRDTHGCPTCAEHWDFTSDHGTCLGEDGMTPIWDDCPDCNGEGSVI